MKHGAHWTPKRRAPPPCELAHTRSHLHEQADGQTRLGGSGWPARRARSLHIRDEPARDGHTPRHAFDCQQPRSGLDRHDEHRLSRTKGTKGDHTRTMRSRAPRILAPTTPARSTRVAPFRLRPQLPRGGRVQRHRVSRLLGAGVKVPAEQHGRPLGRSFLFSIVQFCRCDLSYTNTNPNRNRITCDPGQTRNKLLEQWVNKSHIQALAHST